MEWAGLYLWILDERGEPRPADPVTWLKWYKTAQRNVTVTNVGGIIVSTVFLGVDQAGGQSDKPVLWETDVFGGEFDGKTEQYNSRESALKGHDEMVDKVIAAVTQ